MYYSSLIKRITFIRCYLRRGSLCGAAPSGGIGMNWELIKHTLCRLIATTAILLAGAMVSAAAAGSMPLWAALLGLFASVVLLNAVCGILLGAPSRTAETVLPASHNRPAVQLQVVRGGHAA